MDSGQPLPIGLYIDLGNQASEEIARLRVGTGALRQRVRRAIAHWRDELGIEGETEVVPVILLYRRAETRP
jgi:hypothetical protein